MSASLALVAAGVLAAGCHKASGSGQAPLEAFAPGEWHTPKGKVIKVPEQSNRDWRVLMLQEKPRPKQNPHWKTIPIAQSGALEMPAGSHYKCIYNPVAFRAWPNEHLTEVSWDLMRSVRCSSDDWATYSQATHVVKISPDGSSVVPAIDQTQLSLHEVIDGHPIDIAIVLRAD